MSCRGNSIDNVEVSMIPKNIRNKSFKKLVTESKPVPQDMINKINKLTEGVEIDLDEPLGRERMMVTLNETMIFSEILDERKRQDEKWGGADHDDQHEPNNFVDFIWEHANRVGVPAVGEYDNARKQFIRVAALAVAAVESIDRKID